MQQQEVKRFYSDERTRGRVRGALDEYLGFFDEDKGGDVTARKAGYTTMINHYYDLVTDFYEHGWAQSFHFAPRFKGESLDSLAGTLQVSRMLGAAAEALIAGGEAEIFTPNYFFLVRRPAQ